MTMDIKNKARQSKCIRITVMLSITIIYCQLITIEAFLSGGYRILVRRSLYSPALESSCRYNGRKNHPNASDRRLALYNSKKDEDNVMLLPLLEAELNQRTGKTSSGLGDDDDENSRRIEELKELIDNAKTSAEFGVRRAQAEFYEAFSTGDLEKMKTVWLSSENNDDDVCCVHPAMERIQGYTAVMKSWEQIFMGESFQIEPSRVKIDICGQTAICTCVENTEGGRLEALNIYRRDKGTWKMSSHMASPTIILTSPANDLQ